MPQRGLYAPYSMTNSSLTFLLAAYLFVLMVIDCKLKNGIQTQQDLDEIYLFLSFFVLLTLKQPHKHINERIQTLSHRFGIWSHRYSHHDSIVALKKEYNSLDELLTTFDNLSAKNKFELTEKGLTDPDDNSRLKYIDPILYTIILDPVVLKVEGENNNQAYSVFDRKSIEKWLLYTLDNSRCPATQRPLVKNSKGEVEILPLVPEEAKKHRKYIDELRSALTPLLAPADLIKENLKSNNRR